MAIVQIAGALLIYPGLLLTLGWGALYATITMGQSWRSKLAPTSRLMVQPRWWNLERAISGISVVLAGCGLALLPWPWHPFPTVPAVWLWAWLALEAAFLLPLLPALLTGNPLLVRAASRAAQLGAAGRALLWLVLAVGLLLHTNWQLADVRGHSPLVVHVLALLSAIFAFPCAVGWGAFEAEKSITPGGLTYGLDRSTSDVVRAADTICTAALLAASLLALLPVALLPPPVGMLLLLIGFGVASMVLKQLSGLAPRLTLPGALRACLWRALPLGAAAVMYMSIISA